MDPSSPDITASFTHHAYHWVSSVVTGVVASVLSFTIPEEIVSYGVKILLAFPVGLMTGFGTVAAPILWRKIFTKKV